MQFIDPAKAAAIEARARARTRRVERHTAASLRALAQQPSAEYKSNRVLVAGEPLRFAAPYLVADIENLTLPQSRGVADALALRLRYSNAQLHRELQPLEPLARVIFDILEQLRAESLAADSMPGLRDNLNAAFDRWCSEARQNGFAESDLGILLYTLIHMVRARLIRNVDNEDVAALIEATRANIAPLIGTPFYQLPKTRERQRDYAVHAVAIANSLAELVDHAEAAQDNKTKRQQRQLAALPPDWDLQESPDEHGEGGGKAVASSEADELELENAGDYHVFTREFDQQVTPDSLYPHARLKRYRHQLDRLVAAQSVSVNRLAFRMQRLFATLQDDDWHFGQEEGWLDARRLTQLVATPSYRQVYYRNRQVPQSDVVVSFLIDTSGSMKTQRYEAVATLVDTYSRALELAGIKSEVLGFSTAGWNGGRVMDAWRRAGEPDDPGRLNELQHIVYKSADSTWRQSRLTIAAMMETLHYREGIDGEALLWAYKRLQARGETRRYLVMVSDGAPMDAATGNSNREGFLLDHLVAVAEHIDRRSPVHIGCISVDLDTSHFVTNSVSADLRGTLGNTTYRLLDQLFSSRRH